MVLALYIWYGATESYCAHRMSWSAKKIGRWNKSAAKFRSSEGKSDVQNQLAISREEAELHNVPSFFRISRLYRHLCRRFPKSDCGLFRTDIPESSHGPCRVSHMCLRSD